jgi:hypothetical protein
MKYLVIIFLLVSNAAHAQNLAPYQVQNLKTLDMAATWGYKNLDFSIIRKAINEAPNLFVNGCATFQEKKNLA